MMKILLIDDDVEAAELVGDLLKRTWEVVVEIGTTAGEAQRMIEASGAPDAQLYDLIVLDIGLPDFDGIELCRRVRQVPTLSLVPIVMVSGHCGEQQIEAAFEAGATDYVCKPVRSRELVARIRVALREKRVREHERSVTHELTAEAEDLKRTNATLERLSAVDALTQLPNRRQFNGVFLREWRRAARGAGQVAVVMIDIDHFHAFNALYGHLVGDQCLVRVARALAASVQRPTDLVARWGGEEFIYVLPDTELEGARVIADKVRVAVEELAIPHAASDAGPVVTISVGVASTKPTLERSPEELLGAADDALFRAKSMGRNRVSVAVAGYRRPSTSATRSSSFSGMPRAANVGRVRRAPLRRRSFRPRSE